MAQKSMAPLGTQISYALKARGVDVVFGIPGVHNQELYRGLKEAGLRHILARHEQGAGFMADGYARATGRAGVAFVITGLGLCNIMTALGQAYSDSVPLLVFSSCLDDIETRKGQLHQMKDQLAAAATVCDWSELAQSDAQVYRLMDQAFAEIAQQRPRPKHIQIPITSLAAAAQAAPAAQPLPRAPAPVAGDIAKAAEMLRLAKKPLVILGGGARAVSVMPLLQQLDAASFTTYAGRGVVDRAYPLHFGSLLARSGAKSVLGSADLVLVIGSELSEGDLWRAELGHKAPLIRVDLDSEVLTDSHQAELAISMRAEAFVPALLSQLQGHKAQTVWRAREIQTQRRAWQRQVDLERPGILPICRALQAALPQDTMIFSDMTQFAYLAKEIWPMSKPGHWHHPTGFGTLGYALPAAIGGAIGRPGLPTAAIIGDYGFQYSLPELGVAAELGLSLPIILWDNTKLQEIEDSMISAQIAPQAVQALNPNFSTLAEAYGCAACKPSLLADLPGIMEAAFCAGRPTLIHLTPDMD